jgi:hypothetical protein
MNNLGQLEHVLSFVLVLLLEMALVRNILECKHEVGFGFHDMLLGVNLDILSRLQDLVAILVVYLGRWLEKGVELLGLESRPIVLIIQQLPTNLRDQRLQGYLVFRFFNLHDLVFIVEI